MNCTREKSQTDNAHRMRNTHTGHRTYVEKRNKSVSSQVTQTNTHRLELFVILKFTHFETNTCMKHECNRRATKNRERNSRDIAKWKQLRDEKYIVLLAVLSVAVCRRRCRRECRLFCNALTKRCSIVSPCSLASSLSLGVSAKHFFFVFANSKTTVFGSRVHYIHCVACLEFTHIVYSCTHNIRLLAGWYVADSHAD